MELSKLTSLYLILTIVLVFLIFLSVFQIKSKDKYPGLRFIIISSFLQIISILGFILGDISSNNLRDVSFTIAYISLLTGYLTFGKALTLLLDKKLLKNYDLYGFLLSVVILIVGIIFSGNRTILLLLVTLTFLIFSIGIFIVINYNYTAQQKLKVLPYTIINAIPLLYLLINIIQKIFIQGLPLDSIVTYQGDSILLKAIGIVLSTNTVGILSIINNINFSFISLEDEAFNQLFDTVPNVVIIVDPKTNLIKYVNKAFAKKLGYSKKYTIDKYRLDELIVERKHLDDITPEKLQNVYKIKTKDKLEFYVTVNRTKVNFEDQKLLVLTINDISELYTNQNKLTKLAYYDELTNLPNRRVLYEKFNQMVSLNSRFTLFILDLDNFKQINDRYGHLVGDEILIFVARLLRSFIKEDELASRYGGDEFIILLNTSNQEYSHLRIKQLIELFNEPYQPNNYNIKINLSFGLSCYPEHGRSLTALIEKADQDLYENKKASSSKELKFDKK